jgi:ABC-type glycerol-3-phosphate transport system substrate-binding protein
MQRHTSHPVPIRAALVTAGLLVGLGVVLAVPGAGCVGPGTPPPPANPFAGTALTVACPDPAFAQELSGRCAAWAARTGATVKVLPEPPTGAADVAVIRPAELGAFAARGELATLPAVLREPSHPLQWRRIASLYQSFVPGWGTEVVGLPLAGDGLVLVYRADRLDKAPATWEDVAEEAARSADGKPRLPPLPADPAKLLALFQHIAACYDRKAVADAEREGAAGGLSLHFHPVTWEPRLEAPAFVAAANWLNETSQFRPPGTGDPVEALAKGTAALAVLSLADLARLPRQDRAVAPEYRVAALPGTRTYFDSAGKRGPAGPAGNFVPFLGFGGKVGVVFKRSPGAAAAWDLLAELASPSAGRAILSNPALGAGPYRIEHTEPSVWLGYGFDADRTEDLARATARYLGVTVSNPVVALRTPDQAELLAALEAEVRKTAAGQAAGAEAMARAAEAWRTHDAGKNADELKRWRRNSVVLP